MRLYQFLPLLFAVLSLPAYALDEVGFKSGATCQSAIDAELERGSRPQSKPEPAEPVLKDFYGTQIFNRTHNGSLATVIYLCGGRKNSGGSLEAQLIYLDFDSELAAQTEYSRQLGLLEQQLGTPCFKPSPDRVEGLGARTVWNMRPGIETDLSWHKVVNRQPLHWTVLIGTHGLTDMRQATEPLRTAFASSSCEQVNGSAPAGSPPNTSFERTRGR